MNEATRRQEPVVWVTWAAKMMAGEALCEWASWFRAHYTYDKLPRDFDVEQGRAQHLLMVHAQEARLQADGYRVCLEGQNTFTLPGKNGVILSGQPDLIAHRHDGCLILDCQPGQPKMSDQYQVLISLLTAPFVRSDLQRRPLHGIVQYPHATVALPPEKLDSMFKAYFRQTMDTIASTTAPPRRPSRSECRDCDIGKGYCPARLERPSDAAQPAHDLF